MEYYNIIIFILIFLIVLVSFYLIISNFGIRSNENYLGTNENYFGTNNVNENLQNSLENKLTFLKSELTQIKNKLGTSINIPLNNDNTSTKEIIIEQDNPIVGISSTPDLLNKTESGSCTNCNKPPPVVYDPIANYDIAKLSDPLVDPRGRTSADQIPTPQVAMQFNFPTQGVLDKYHRVGLLIGIDTGVKREKIDKIELPYSISDNSSYNSNSDNLTSGSGSGSGSGSDNEFIWNGPSKTNINRRKKKFTTMETNNSSSKSYKGIDIKENFDTLSDSDSYEYFGNTDKSITNVYNVYSNNNDNNILELIGKKITDNWYKYFTSITMGNKIIKVVVHNKNRKELYSGDIIYIPELKRTYRVKIDPMDMIEYNPYFF